MGIQKVVATSCAGILGTESGGLRPDSTDGEVSGRRSEPNSRPCASCRRRAFPVSFSTNPGAFPGVGSAAVLVARAKAAEVGSRLLVGSRDGPSRLTKKVLLVVSGTFGVRLGADRT